MQNKIILPDAYFEKNMWFYSLTREKERKEEKVLE